MQSGGLTSYKISTEDVAKDSFTNALLSEDKAICERVQAGMQAWLESNRQHRHGAHSYSLADFGLPEEEVERRLLFYRERYGIPHETTKPPAAGGGTAIGSDTLAHIS